MEKHKVGLPFKKPQSSRPLPEGPGSHEPETRDPKTTSPPDWFETVEGIMKSLIDPITAELKKMEERLKSLEDLLTKK
ncbi:hypothetical protein CIPAW_14G032200 [Carya illinoinensis]|uniref:Uncharacterized protein n=1 Tax=Carya illinoinensis TaxID=32201 RepID=A0A8T1NEB4_CARIL|nr:hypothetical protein CIPAW_14G032200 [Carya illinoinensis]